VKHSIYSPADTTVLTYAETNTQHQPSCGDEMPEYYIEFDKRLCSEAAYYKLSKEAV
jgi:hypothetical protein